MLTDAVGFLPSPGYEGDQPAPSDEDWEFDGRQTDPLIADRWSMATMRVLSSMPSRTIGEFRGGGATEWLWASAAAAVVGLHQEHDLL